MKKVLCVIVLFIILSSLLFTVASYAEKSLPTTTDENEEATQKIIDSIDLTKSDDIVENAMTSFFDVNDEYIALGYTVWPPIKKQICLYDKDFNFICSYEFNSPGNAYVILEDDYFAIWLVRGDIYVEADYDANILRVARVDDTEENDIYFEKEVEAFEKYANDKTYKISTIGGFFTATDAEGNSEVLYDASFGPIPTILIVFAFEGLLFFSVIFNVVRKVKKATTTP